MIRNEAIEGVLDGDQVTVLFFSDPRKLLEHCRKHVLIDRIPALASEDAGQVQGYRDKLSADERTPKNCLTNKWKDLCWDCQQAEHCLNLLAPLMKRYRDFVNRQLTSDGPKKREAQHGHEKKGGGVPFACCEGLFAAMYPGAQNASAGRSPYKLVTAYCPEPRLPASLGLATELVHAGLAPRTALSEQDLEDRYLAAFAKMRTRALEPYHCGALRES